MSGAFGNPPDPDKIWEYLMKGRFRNGKDSYWENNACHLVDWSQGVVTGVPNGKGLDDKTAVKEYLKERCPLKSSLPSPSPEPRI